jgi:predicted DNA-binding protein
MEVRLTPDLEAKLNQLSAETGRAKEELVQDAMAGYLAELSQVRSTLDARYDDIKSGRPSPSMEKGHSPACAKRQPIIAVAESIFTENLDRHWVEQAFQACVKSLYRLRL